MKKTLFLFLFVSLLTAMNLKAQDYILANFDTTDPQPMTLAKWANGNEGIWQDTGIVVAYDTVPNPLTDGFNTSPYCMRVGQVENADWWGNFSGIALPNIVASADSMNGSGILVTSENHYLKVFVLRSNNLVGFRVCVGTTENPSNGMDYTSSGGTCPFLGEGAVPDNKVGIWYDCVYDLTAIIGQHIRTVGIINSENWNNPRTPTPAADFYYDNFVLSADPTPRDVVVPPLKSSSDGFYIGFEDSLADNQWYSDITVQDPLSSYSIVKNTPDNVNATTKAMQYDKSASAPYAQSGPLFDLNGGIPTSTNQYLHVFVKVPDGAIDPNTGYCEIQLIARNWQVGDSAMVNVPVFDSNVWQDIVLPITTPIGGSKYITNFSVLLDCRLNQYGKYVSSPANTFYLDGVVLNNSSVPRTSLSSPQDYVLADFDVTDPQPMVLAKYADGNEGIWQGGTPWDNSGGDNITAYDTVPNPLTDGFNTSPYCMRVGQAANADWWGNFSGIALPNIVASADSMNGSGILVTQENHYLKLFVLRSNNLVGFRVCVSTTENPSNGMDYTSAGGTCPFLAEGAVPDNKVGIWYDCVYDLTAIIGQHIRTVGIINSENWNNPRTATPATDFYYDNFVLSSDPTPRDVVVPPLQSSSDGFYIGFEDSTADHQWYESVSAQDALSSYSIVNNTPDDVNLTTKAMQYDKSASAPYAQSGPLFTLNGGIPTSTNQYLHVFVKVPDGAIDPNTGYCEIQLIARNWQVGDSAMVSVPVFDSNVWQDIVLPITAPIGGSSYISNFSLLFDCRLNQFGKYVSSPANTFYLDGVVLNNSETPRTSLEEQTGIPDITVNNLKAFNSSKNTITVTPADNSKITIFNSIGQTVSSSQSSAGSSQQFNVGQPGIYIVSAETRTSKQTVKVLVQ